jgi:hypothetical protein
VPDVICSIYSSALSIQLLGQHFIAVPRFIWCTLPSLVIFALAYGGRNVLEEITDNLLGGYDVTAWQDPKRVPPGLAGTASLLGGIGFSFLGMDQTWVRPMLPQLLLQN